MPEPSTPGEADRVAVAFARAARRAGLDVPVAATVVLGRALAAVGLRSGRQVYWAGRAVLVRRPEDVGRFDAVFESFWSGAPEPGPGPAVARLVDPEPGGDEPVPSPDAGEPGGDAVLGARWSAHEVLRRRDFAAYTAAEHAEARRLMGDLRLAGATRRSRRRRPATGRSGRPDLRRTVQHALRTGGEPLRRPAREPRRTPRRVVLLLDVSGSMEPYARALVRFLHAGVVGGTRVEAFAMGTRLTRLTRELQSRDPDAALAAATRRATDWAGGTRLGAGLQRFNDEWGIRGLARGAIVVVLSDGWDRGDPGLLAEQMARLARVAHRVVWVNPLKATPGYAPATRGMMAAMPYVDDFVEGHSLAALQELAALLASDDGRRR